MKAATAWHGTMAVPRRMANYQAAGLANSQRQELLPNRRFGRSSLDSAGMTCQNSALRPHDLLFNERSMDSHASPIAADDVFQADDVAQFTADDTEAGQAICTMLSMMFAYTVAAMTVTTLVTLYWTRH